jgi:hypothetical protein
MDFELLAISLAFYWSLLITVPSLCKFNYVRMQFLTLLVAEEEPQLYTYTTKHEINDAI